MRNLGFLALAAALLITTPAMAQDDLEARRAAAHEMMDPVMAASINQIAPSLRAQLALPDLDPAEQTAMYAAFDQRLPDMLREAQDLAAKALADEWSLDALRDPASMDAARMEALTARLQPTMEAVGERFALHVLKTGCSIDADPSAACVRMLEEIRKIEAGE